MDRFRLERKLGAGAFGEAHLATDATTGAKVVLKFILPDFVQDAELRERFRREIRALELVKHPNIPALVAHGEDRGRVYYAVEFCEGADLNKAISNSPGPWSFERALGVMEDLLAALGAAHEKGVVHRDVKPANILLVKEQGRERAKLIDFGIAKHFDAGDNTMQDLTQGRAIGTPYYLSPEQAEGEIVDARTDLYAAGIVLYELLAGTRPFSGESTNAILKSILYDSPDPIRKKRKDAPEALEKAVSKLLAKHREQRPANAAEAAKLIRAAIEPVLVPKTPATTPEYDGSMLTGILVNSTAKEKPPTAPDPWIGKTLAGKYELRALLGRGGFGAVYKAWHKELELDVAVKLIALGGHEGGAATLSDKALEDLHERFRREARVMRSFVHKHAVQVRDFGREGSTFYLELDYLEGETLLSLLQREKKIPEERALEVAGQVLSALAEAHRKGIVHRDLKPANIFLTRSEGARILDFGIVKLVGALENTTDRGNTAAGVSVGTVPYMSPEQAGGDEVGKPSDVYSMAVVLYQCLAGSLPIDGGSEASQASLRARIMTKPPRPLEEVAPDVSARTKTALMRALAKEATGRPQDASAFAEELLSGTPHFLAVGAQTQKDAGTRSQDPTIPPTRP
ncbi:MAG: serine/threonine-protein kinase, partial [Planctomycetota bacterium]